MRADQRYIMSKRDPRTLDQHLRDIQSHLEQGLTGTAIHHIDALREALWEVRSLEEMRGAWAEKAEAAKKGEVQKCLKWAAGFAEGSRDWDPSLDNYKFNEWIDRCNKVIEGMVNG